MDTVTIYSLSKLLTILGGLAEKMVTVHIISNHWDPDSMGCLFVARAIFIGRAKAVKLYLPGRPDNFQQNKDIAEEFGLHDIILPLDENFPKNIGPDDVVVCVDTPRYDDKRFTFKMPKPQMLIDHHARPDDAVEGENEWYWYGKFGACVTMLAMIVKETGAFERMDEVDRKKTATLGLLGILGDAKKLTARSTTEMDFEMAAFLRKYADQEKIFKVTNAAFDEEFLDALGVPRENWKRVGTVMVIRLDSFENCANEEQIFKAAEWIMTFKKVQTIFVWTLLGKNKISIKARNSNPAVSLDKELKDKFGEKFGGAKDNSSGGSFILLDEKKWPAGEDPDDELFLEFCKRYMYRKVFGSVPK